MSILDNDIAEQFEQSTTAFLIKWRKYTHKPLMSVNLEDGKPILSSLSPDTVYSRPIDSTHTLVGTKEDGFIKLDLDQMLYYLSLRKKYVTTG